MVKETGRSLVTEHSDLIRVRQRLLEALSHGEKAILEGRIASLAQAKARMKR